MSKVKITQVGQPCRRCQTPVIRQEHKELPKYKAGGYWFTYWFKCPSCSAFYMVEAAKRFFDEKADTAFAG